VFTSGSTVTHLLDVLREAGLAFPAQVAAVSIGPVTSAALREAELPVSAEADAASLDALIDACVRLLAR
jgi:uroporphyrinogen-III synthase